MAEGLLIGLIAVLTDCSKAGELTIHPLAVTEDTMVSICSECAGKESRRVYNVVRFPGKQRVGCTHTNL